ncbi:penicillin acylase family protein [Solicola sp. PLA-1-18]|uniref:penicillin acylase family protein n=1 Tax=Solicola sp. PLA-1-18 TaxID=3380532 RepID=UPI003B7FDBBF
MSDPGRSTRVEVGRRRATVARDDLGVAHVSAVDEASAWCGLGWAAATDRLWQMEHDRRRAAGTLCEVVGATALSADRLARRLDLVRAARRDVEAMDDATAETFDAYAAGVNARVAEHGVSEEMAEAGVGWTPWTVVDSVAAFKVRHVLMGVWQYKLARATVLARSGLQVFDLLDPRVRPGMRVSVPATARLEDTAARDALLDEARRDVEDAAEHLGFLAEVEAGSNAWAVGPGRSATGAAILANDSHRALDAPNVYWQAYLRCDAFDVAGATFPGIPGFPHFGHNGHVGWAITNAAADAQDLYVEQADLSGAEPRVRSADGWDVLERRTETIVVRGGDDVVQDCWRTPRGPVVHGDPATGSVLSLRWTAADRPCRQFGVLAAMLRARTVNELLDVQDPWVDPVNNLLAADTAGHLGYRLRGELPRRRSDASTQVPVPAWGPSAVWDGLVAPGDMPRLEDPPEQVIVSTNNLASTNPYPLVSHAVNDAYRAERVHELLEGDGHTPASMAAAQGDTVSVAARRWAEHLATRGPYDGDAEAARLAIVSTAGDLRGDGTAAVVHACFRRELLADALAVEVGPVVAGDLLASRQPGTPVLLRRWFAQLTWPRGPGEDVPAARLGDDLVERCLARALSRARKLDATWAEVHTTQARHPLGRHLDPAPVGLGGDNETVANAAYGWVVGMPFTITNLSVYRQVLDLSDLDASGWIVPGGVDGRATAPHGSDQLEPWRDHRLAPMRRSAGPDPT